MSGRWSGRTVLAVAFLVGLLVILWLGSPASLPRRTLVVTGSSTIAPVMAEIGRQFEADRPGVRVDVQSGGSSRGLADARHGLADIGMVSRNPLEGEGDLAWFPLARDGVALILHRDNPIESLDEKEVVGIYRGTIRNWRRLGGPDRPITVVNKAEGRSTLEVFLRHFGLSNEEIRADVIIGDNEQGIKTVAGNPDAIGYVSIGTATYDIQKGVPIKLPRLDGVEASLAHVRDGTFPVTRTLNLVVRGEPSGLAADFLNFSRSTRMNRVIRAFDFEPVHR
ncbi:MAG: phosphate ABC transporter substrate-binding protein [Acidobacteriota bacterium]